MKAPKLTDAFTRDDSGAFHLDRAILSAAIAGLVMVAMVSIGAGITGLGDAIVVDLDSRQTS